MTRKRAASSPRIPHKGSRPTFDVKGRLDDGSVTSLRRRGNPEGVSVATSRGDGLAIHLHLPRWSLPKDESISRSPT